MLIVFRTDILYVFPYLYTADLSGKVSACNCFFAQVHLRWMMHRVAGSCGSRQVRPLPHTTNIDKAQHPLINAVRHVCTQEFC